MAETLTDVAPAVEVPTRQSGPENIFGFMAWRLGPIIPDYPLGDLRLYEPRWVWPPSFRHTEHYRRLLQSIRESGLFRPLLVLPDGRTVDGQHRYSCAKELDLESLPVRIIEAPQPLSDADRLVIEEWAVYDNITRRHLTRAQATEILYDLLRARNEVQATVARLANLKRGNRESAIRPDPSHLTVKELAVRAGKSQRSVERAVSIVRYAPPEIQAQLRSGELTLGGAERAMKAAQAGGSNVTGDATASSPEWPGTKPARGAAGRARAAPNVTHAGATGTEKRVPAASESMAPAEARSPFASVAETFVDSAKAVVRRARTWNREALEQLSHALRQIESGLRDGAARARGEPR